MVRLRMTLSEFLEPSDWFAPRHLGPSDEEVSEMLKVLGATSLDALADETVPADIRTSQFEIPAARSEAALLRELAAIAEQNQVWRSFIGTGYHGTITPPVILRNVLENPGWYTQYTPYQPEIAQGRLEALLNFQTMVSDLTALPLANASLLDEATAAAEAMAMARSATRGKKTGFFVAEDCHPQTIAVVETRARPLGIELHVGAPEAIQIEEWDLFGAVLSYPTTDGRIVDYEALCRRVHDHGGLVIVAADPLALTLLRPPGEFGADIAIGSTQRFGVPVGYGGPHAAYLAARDEYRRQMPGRLVGVSRDRRGRVAYRLALQTREQHIRRDRATSNICTAQALLAIMASMYAVHHGADGLVAIARRVRGLTRLLAHGLGQAGLACDNGELFDTVRLRVDKKEREAILDRARAKRINLREFDDGLGVTLDERSTTEDVADLLAVLTGKTRGIDVSALAVDSDLIADYPSPLQRTSAFLTHEVFTSHRSEHELLRYLHRLQSRDLSLTTSMIPLGSCTMKLNATSRDASGDLAGICRRASVCAGRPGQGLSTSDRGPRGLVSGNDRVCRRVADAELGGSGRVRRVAHHSGLSRRPW